MFAFTGRARARVRNRRNRLCRVEQLECRDMLSAAPTVVGVEFSGSTWSSAFVQHLRDASLGNDGYAVPVGSADQSLALPWTNLDEVRITFSEDVRIDPADLSISGVNSTNYMYEDFHYDPQMKVAVWTFGEPFTKDRLRIDLNANWLSPIRDLEGYHLDGDWVNNAGTYPSGDGVAGGDFEFTFNVLPADVDGSGSVENADYAQVASLNGVTTFDPAYTPFADLDGSGVIDSADENVALERYVSADQLPTGLPAGTYNDAPTTRGFGLTSISNDAVDTAIALLGRFDDTESGAGGLTYSIVSNTNASLFDYAYINHSTKKLVMNTASGASGRAVITVEARDPGGLTTRTTLTVDVNYDNVGPTLYLEWPDYIGGDTWIIRGHVVDPDDDLSRFIVDFYGAFDTRTAVDEFGYFEFAVILEPEDWGHESAITADPHGYYSNQVDYYIGLA